MTETCPLYALALLNLMNEENAGEHPPLGMATRIGLPSSVLSVPAHRFLQALIEYAPDPAAVAKEFLVELGKCGLPNIQRLAKNAWEDVSLLMDPKDWAMIVHEELCSRAGDIKHLTDLASHYWSHLVIAFRNPGGKRTPQTTAYPTPNIRRIEDIQDLSEKVSHGNQSALRDLIFLRDGRNCPMTGFSFFPPNPTVPRCSHIIPISIHEKTQTYVAIETFTGDILSAEMVRQNINHPRNALNLQGDAYDCMNKYMAWGIEARSYNNQWRYFYRVVRQNFVHPLIINKLEDDQEIVFGKGEGGDHIPLPDPTLCNLSLAVARVSFASGASEIFDQFIDDEGDDGMRVPVYFGSPFVSDDVLMRRLEVLVP